MTPQSVIKVSSEIDIAPQFVKITKNIQTLIVEYTIDIFLHKKVSKEAHELGYDILKEFLSK